MSFKDIDETRYKGCFRPHYGQVDGMRFGPLGQTFKIGHIHGNAFCQSHHPRTARNRIELLHLRTLGEFPNNCMFAAATADDEYIHTNRPPL